MRYWSLSAVLGLLLLVACGDDGGGTAELSCSAGSTLCGDLCVNTDTDQANCGVCGNACEPGFVCNGSGTCALSCQEGLVDCDGRCVDPKTDLAFCGAGPDCAAEPGTACAAGEICDGAGQCALSCQEGLVDCDGRCVDPLTDRAFCGAGPDCAAEPGTACAAGEICDGAGQCALACQAGLVACDGTCIDPDSDRSFCGASGACDDDATDGEICDPGEICNAGACELSCQDGLMECGGVCTNTDTDRSHCGVCFNACADGFVCNGAGACAPSCRDDLTICNGACTDTDIDPDHCGTCNTPCAAGKACLDGVCI